jgi:hypothetical protein
VGGDVGELFEVAVGAGELLGLLLEPPVGVLDQLAGGAYLGEVLGDLVAGRRR